MTELRTDQLDFLACVQSAWRLNKHVCAQAGCGWGKTHVIAEASKRAAARQRRVLIVAHRRRLIQQISDRLAAFGIPHGLIMANLPDALAARHEPGALVQVASKDTLISRAEREGFPFADLVIPDECHNLLGSGYANLMSHYTDSYWLGLTATPVAGDGRGLGGFFGELVCAPPVSQLIAAGTIVPFRVYAALEMAEARRTGGKVKPTGDPVAQWLKHAEGRPTVLFAPRVADSESVVRAFDTAGIPAVHIDSHSSEEDRDAASDGLASGDIKVVSQVGLWTEGVDVPCVAVVQLLARCGSLVKYLQAVWRAGRSHPGKEIATVIDHSGAVFDHGFPDDDLEWSLSGGDPIKRDSSERGPREPFVCTACGLVYSGANSCPGCGSAFAINRKMYQPDLFAHLVEVDRDFTAAQSSETDQRQWTKLLYQFARTGKPVKALVAAFRGRTGKWPDEAGVEPLYSRADMAESVVDVFPAFGARPARRESVSDSVPSLFGGEE